MNCDQALTNILDRVGASDKPMYVGFDEVQEWHVGVLDCLVASGLLSKAVDTQSLQCEGCEHQCFMDVLLTSDSQRAFIVCDHPEMQSQMGRINLAMERLQQWQSSTRKVAGVVARLLGIDSRPDNQKNAAVYRLGMLESNKGRQWVSINSKPLTLELNGQTRPLSEWLYFKGDELLIDCARVDDMLNAKVGHRDTRYTSNTNKRDARKLATSAKHQDWKDEYLKLKKKYPSHSDEWIALKIGKMDISQGNSASRIRKIMK